MTIFLALQYLTIGQVGPHKGKDFANVYRPCIVTKDEFEKYRCTISRETHPEQLAMPTGSGTVGWGSLIENNFSGHRALKPGDVVELEIRE